MDKISIAKLGLGLVSLGISLATGFITKKEQSKEIEKLYKKK